MSQLACGPPAQPNPTQSNPAIKNKTFENNFSQEWVLGGECFLLFTSFSWVPESTCFPTHVKSTALTQMSNVRLFEPRKGFPKSWKPHLSPTGQPLPPTIKLRVIGFRQGQLRKLKLFVVRCISFPPNVQDNT